MKDFVPTMGVVKHKRQESGPSNVPFVETGGSRKWSPTCYCCGEQHPGGYKKCSNVLEVVRQQTIKAVKAGHFQRKRDNNNTISTKATTSTSRKSTPKK